MKNLIIYGAGGHGKICKQIATKIGRWKHITFYDDFNNEGLFLKKDIDSINQYVNDENDFFVAIGDNIIRNEKFNYLKELGANIVSLIDNQSIVCESSIIGEGVLIMPGAIVNGNACIGKGVIINTSSVIEHDTLINDFCHISPCAVINGSCKIGRLVWIGSNATVINNIDIIDNVIIGAGSVVIRNIDVKGTFVGNPARKIR